MRGRAVAEDTAARGRDTVGGDGADAFLHAPVRSETAGIDGGGAAHTGGHIGIGERPVPHLDLIHAAVEETVGAQRGRACRSDADGEAVGGGQHAVLSARRLAVDVEPTLRAVVDNRHVRPLIECQDGRGKHLTGVVDPAVEFAAGGLQTQGGAPAPLRIERGESLVRERRRPDPCLDGPRRHLRHVLSGIQRHLHEIVSAIELQRVERRARSEGACDRPRILADRDRDVSRRCERTGVTDGVLESRAAIESRFRGEDETARLRPRHRAACRRLRKAHELKAVAVRIAVVAQEFRGDAQRAGLASGDEEEVVGCQRRAIEQQRERIDRIGQAVVVRVGIERIGAARDFLTVREAIVVGVRLRRISAGRAFGPVVQPVIVEVFRVGIRGERVHAAIGFEPVVPVVAVIVAVARTEIEDGLAEAAETGQPLGIERIASPQQQPGFRGGVRERDIGRDGETRAGDLRSACEAHEKGVGTEFRFPHE